MTACNCPRCRPDLWKRIVGTTECSKLGEADIAVSAGWSALSDEDRTRLVRDWFHANGPDSWEESERRISLLADITDGFCRACGQIRPSGICHCENDE